MSKRKTYPSPSTIRKLQSYNKRPQQSEISRKIQQQEREIYDGGKTNKT